MVFFVMSALANIPLLFHNIQVLEGTPEWEVLAELNSYDMRLYELIVELFDTQKDIVYSY